MKIFSGDVLLHGDFESSSAVACLWIFSLLQIQTCKSSFQSERSSAIKAKKLLAKVEHALASQTVTEGNDTSTAASFDPEIGIACQIGVCVEKLCYESDLNMFDCLKRYLTETSCSLKLLPHILGSALLHSLQNIKIALKCIECIDKFISSSSNQVSVTLCSFNLFCTR